MADVFDKEKRSWLMSRVRSCGNRTTEQRLAGILRRQQIVGWRRGYRLLGKPDFVFPGARIVIFVDGCFWHGCPLHGQIPNQNRAFWEKKINGNVRRDVRLSRKLRVLGWHVFRIWEHDLNKPALNCKLGKIRRILNESNRKMGKAGEA